VKRVVRHSEAPTSSIRWIGLTVGSRRGDRLSVRVQHSQPAGADAPPSLVDHRWPFEESPSAMGPSSCSPPPACQARRAQPRRRRPAGARPASPVASRYAWPPTTALGEIRAQLTGSGRRELTTTRRRCCCRRVTDGVATHRSAGCVRRGRITADDVLVAPDWAGSAGGDRPGSSEPVSAKSLKSVSPSLRVLFRNAAPPAAKATNASLLAKPPGRRRITRGQAPAPTVQPWSATRSGSSWSSSSSRRASNCGGSWNFEPSSFGDSSQVQPPPL
jgi:hypothetical protein